MSSTSVEDLAAVRFVRPRYETVTFGVPQSGNAFDPTADMLPPAGDTSAGQQAQTEGKRYFNRRGIIHLEVTGNDSGEEA